MDFDSEGPQESLIHPAPERTALRTRQLLIAGSLAFVFSHGALIISASAALGLESDASWWLVFLPVWLGNALCLVCMVASWFASCPYVQLCLSESQARLGDDNPSILTEILPDIVMAFLGLVFIALELAAEILLCRYLSGLQRGAAPAILPAAVVFMAVSLLASCRGVCLRTSSATFLLCGAGLFASSAAALRVEGGLPGPGAWLLVLPWCGAAAGLLAAAARRLRACGRVLSREERLLGVAEQVVLLGLLAALLTVALSLAPGGGCGGGGRLRAGRCRAALPAGAAAGGGVCLLALLWARAALLESRAASVPDRLIAWRAAGPLAGGEAC